MKRPDSYPNTTAGAGNSPYGLFNNETSPGAQDQTPIDAGHPNDLFGAFIALLADQGVVPNGSLENTANSDFLTALKSAVKDANYNPFMNYAHFRDAKTSGTEGGAIVASTWTPRDINTTVVNGISGASLDSGTGRVRLPAGTYRVHARTSAVTPQTARIGVYDVTGAAFLDYGGSATGERIYDGDEVGANPEITTTFTLSVTSDIEVQQWHTFASPRGLGVPTSVPGVSEVYLDIEIWKLT